MIEIPILNPITQVSVLSGIPLDTTYKDTISFGSASAQTSYFLSKAKETFNNVQPVRTPNAIALPKNQSYFLDCNYMMFQNPNFSNKWFYAFITDISWVNVNTTLISYEVDVMQTFMFDYTFKPTFIERETVDNDTIGRHTIPENLETGPYVTTAQTSLLVTNLNFYILLSELVRDDLPFNTIPPGMLGHFPNPCYTVPCGSLSSGLLTDTIKEVVTICSEAGKLDAIVGIFSTPSNMSTTENEIKQTALNAPSRTLNYTPKNNKLYTYPYCALVFTADGQAVELRYENFSQTPSIMTFGGFGMNMEVRGVPQFYEGQSLNYQYSLTLSNFPICAWVGNYFQNWIAQNKANITAETIKSAIQIGFGTVAALGTGGGVGAVIGSQSVLGGLTGIGESMKQIYNQSIVPDKLQGSATAGDILAVSGQAGFRGYCRAIKPEYAQIIDDYFSMYGYKVNEVKVPNLNSRSQWNYIKTQNCNIQGSIPFDSLAKIKSIYNAGVTIWHNPSNVGNYSLANSIV